MTWFVRVLRAICRRWVYFTLALLAVGLYVWATGAAMAALYSGQCPEFRLMHPEPMCRTPAIYVASGYALGFASFAFAVIALVERRCRTDRATGSSPH